MTLEKSRGDAAATLTAVLLTAAADRCFPKESLALGDAVRLLGDAGEEVFLGAVQAVSRNVETVTLIACDRGLYLTANELSGVFAGSPEGICRAVAMRLSLPVGTLEVPAGWKRPPPRRRTRPTSPASDCASGYSAKAGTLRRRRRAACAGVSCVGS